MRKLDVDFYENSGGKVELAAFWKEHENPMMNGALIFKAIGTPKEVQAQVIAALRTKFKMDEVADLTGVFEVINKAARRESKLRAALHAVINLRLTEDKDLLEVFDQTLKYEG